MQPNHTVEFEISGDHAMFAIPEIRVSGEKCSYQIPTYEAIKGILNNIYWKPTLKWYIDEVRVMNRIRTESIGMCPRTWNGSGEMANYTYLKNVRYQVRAHFEWNENFDQFKQDRDWHKHLAVATRAINTSGSGRFNIFLGTSECPCYVKPCKFGEGEGAYDNDSVMSFGVMYHGRTYPNEGYSEETRSHNTTNLWNAIMDHGIIKFPRPEDCPYHKDAGYAVPKTFENKYPEEAGRRDA